MEINISAMVVVDINFSVAGLPTFASLDSVDHVGFDLTHVGFLWYFYSIAQWLGYLGFAVVNVIYCNIVAQVIKNPRLGDRNGVALACIPVVIWETCLKVENLIGIAFSVVREHVFRDS